MVRRVDRGSANRILPRDRKRLIRALEVYFETGRPLTEHFAATTSPLAPGVTVTAIALRLDSASLGERLARRVDEQLAAGIVDEVRSLLSGGVPPSARPFGGLVYRQLMDHLNGVRDLAATRDLIVQENRRYARRQLIWFRKEPNLIWFDGPGEAPEVQARVLTWLMDHHRLNYGGPAAHA
jgi:tRNA dimethylallyltransferase